MVVYLCGFRIDLAELEKEIMKCNPELTMVSVQIQQDSLVAFVAPVSVDFAKVKKRISQYVPAYSVPAQIVALETLPMNPNGKMDHNQVALLSSLTVSSPKSSKSAAPQQRRISKKLDGDERVNRIPVASKALDLAVSKLWMEILSLNTPPAADLTFFEAGGHRYAKFLDYPNCTLTEVTLAFFLPSFTDV